MDEQPKPVEVAATCGICLFWKPVELKGPHVIGQPKRGFCFGAPPVPVIIYDSRGTEAGQKNIRPATHEAEMCGLFSPRPDAM